MKTQRWILSLAAVAFLASCGRNDATTPQDFYSSQLYGNDLPAKTLTLTFDDGPAPRTVELAQYLSAQGIKATFFMVGKNIPGNEGVLAKLRDMGHLIANHSYNHSAMTSTGSPVSEVRNTDALISPYVLGKVFFFRAPYGDWAPRVADVLNNNGLRKYVGTIFWDIGGELTGRYAADWACWSNGVSVSSCADRYANETRDRGHGIVLAHDVHSKTVDMMKILIPRLKSEGFRFVRLDDVPNLAAKVRAAGGTPGGSSTPPVIGRIECPQGYSLESVGTQGGKICTNGTDAWGPFTRVMIDKCLSWGGGSEACNSNRWARSLAISARGTALCPAGAQYDSLTTYCVEGNDAFGPFPAALVTKCENANGGSACASARWNRNFLASLL